MHMNAYVFKSRAEPNSLKAITCALPAYRFSEENFDFLSNKLIHEIMEVQSEHG